MCTSFTCTVLGDSSVWRVDLTFHKIWKVFNQRGVNGTYTYFYVDKYMYYLVLQKSEEHYAFI